MQSNILNYQASKSKKSLIVALYTVALLISGSGVFFIIYSFLYKVSFKVFGADVSGLIFGLMVIYLGIRYFISVSNLKKELYTKASSFSWNNFKK